MEIFNQLLPAYVVLINAFGLVIFGIDKRRAIQNQWRIPEKTLFLVALLGGGLGCTIGMYLFRHKTKHWYFVIGMPAIFIAEFALYWLLIAPLTQISWLG